MSDFRRLQVWQKAHALAIHAHRVATRIRRTHEVPLRSQIVRAAMSIPANIVEGRRQASEKDFARFLRYALNSGCELEYHLIIARDIGALPENECDSLENEAIEVRRMLHGLLNTIKKGPPSTAKVKAD
jgi:four helix bundle protein